MMILTFCLLALFLNPVRAEDIGGGLGVPDTEADAKSTQLEAGPENIDETKALEQEGKEEFLQPGKKAQLTINSINPAHGPTTGESRVVVRGDQIAKFQLAFPEPKCRFGNKQSTVGASYITCTSHIPSLKEKEAIKADRTSTCIQCEAAPPQIESKPVEFSVSLSGDFTDVTSSTTFYYYKPSKVKALKPIHGPKDGGTNVQVWGDNFADFGEDTTCSFGTKAVKATVHSSTYITCTAPASDVVQRAMPFGVSLNGQQQSTGRVDFWYYNNPQVTVAEPASGPGPGPESGGNEVLVRGSNFRPMRTEAGDPDISNSTRCAFTQLNVWSPATILNSTRAICVAPPSYYWKQTPVELTLNAQDWTDDGTLYFYYKPPFLFDAQPRQGPVKGATEVTVIGTQFNNTGNITCRFGEREVPGELLSSSEIKCVSPPYSQPGPVDISISLYPGLWSSPIGYLYYETPTVGVVSPPCGPESGFTQLVVEGTNFIDLGRDSAICVFNGSHHTNATVVSDTVIMCDTPSILNKQGYSEVPEGGSAVYKVDVSLDGGRELSESSAEFRYYRQPTVNSVSPALGPIRAGTKAAVHGLGFGQASACKRVVRVGTQQVYPSSFTNNTMSFETPHAAFPATTVVAVSLNGQQFTSQPAVHSPERSVTFDYYRDPYASLHFPARGPTNGGTLLHAQGYGFMLRRPHLRDRLWVRFVDPATKLQELAPPTEVTSSEQRLDSFNWVTPNVSAAGPALLQISLNNADWHDVRDPTSDTSFTYYTAPRLNSVHPSYGHVKASREQVVELRGTGFECFDSECTDLKCRFGNHPDQYIYTQGKLVSGEAVECKVPEYTKPDVLEVEITINGESYTSDNKTYGFFDPFVLDANPRLIATDGSTQVAIQGIGFVDSGQAKAQYGNRTRNLVCSGESADCSKKATFLDKRTLLAPTYPQSEVKYRDSDKSVMWDPVHVDATVLGDEFTENEVALFYYEDPVLTGTNINAAPANLQAQLIVGAAFGMNDKGRLATYATPKCKFVSGGKSAVTDAQLVAYPFTASRDPSLINAFHCKTPQWQLDSLDAETATLSISLNGQNYAGALEFTFERPLKIHRDIAMAGPQKHASRVTAIGQGYRLKSGESALKWGTQATDPIFPNQVSDYTYAHEEFLNSIPGSQSLRAYQSEARSFARVDSNMTEGANYYDLTSKPAIVESESTSLGGPMYLEVGIDEVLNHTGPGDSEWVLFNAEPSSVEFYSYREPLVQKMHPSSGLTTGGTFVEVVGAWFRYMPEYGIVPHCRFGDKIVRAHYDSTVRLVCQSPANANVTARLPFEVSLNGVDWSNTGFEFSYYEGPVMTDIYPDMGSVAGGDEIYIRGEKFTNHTDPAEFKCRFTPVSLPIPPKTIRARYINSTTIMCPSPGGWSEADRMILQVTWNGVDYDDNHFQFSFYSVHRAFPRSGPSNGHGGDIVVYGQGFRADTSPSCMLNGTQWEPVSVNATEIRCPMPAAEAGDSYFGNVDFAVTANGITWTNFEGGFQYYEQPIVEDIDPKRGPSSGVGIINFYGEGFRADYPLAELGCRVGEAEGRAYYVSPRQVKCVVEDIPLLAEDDEALPAQVSLNSHSYTELAEGTYYRPYGVLQVSPGSIPVGAASTVVVSGQGFVAEEGVTPRCRFGTPADYAISEAEILSYTRLACRAPESLPGTPTASLPRDVPFSVALSGDEFAPWTASTVRSIFYEQPAVASVEPAEVDVGRITTVFVHASDDSEFFDPVSAQPVASEAAEGGHQRGTSLSPLKCKFGRFGESSAVFLNSTTVKCTTPPSDESPDSIYRETVTVSVSMNGQDFMEDTSEAEFTFVGTAPYISFLTIVLGLLALAFVGFAATLCTSDLYQASQMPELAGGWAGAGSGGVRGGGGQLRQAVPGAGGGNLGLD